MATNSEHLLMDTLAIIKRVPQTPLILRGSNAEGISGYIFSVNIADYAYLDVSTMDNRKSYSYRVGQVSTSAIRIPKTNTEFRSFFGELNIGDYDGTHEFIYEILEFILKDRAVNRLVRDINIIKTNDIIEMSLFMDGVRFKYTETRDKIEFMTPLGYVPYTRGFDIWTTINSIKQVLQVD